MTDILLVTAVLRTKNLQAIADNIAFRFKDETELHPVWVWCFDQYNADMSPLNIKRAEVACLENDLSYVIYYQGKPDQENYGGELMNAPLQDLKNKLYKDSNPLVYVLDDDNILHPNFIDTVKEFCLDNDRPLWMNMLDEFGTQRFVRYADRLAYLPGTGQNEGYRIIHPCASCDPSQLVIRLDTLLALGGFENTRDYDYKFMNKIYRNDLNLDNMMMYQATRPWLRDNNFFMSCYHNGLVTNERVGKAIKDLEENFSETKEDSYIKVHTKNDSFVLGITNKGLLEILKKHTKFGKSKLKKTGYEISEQNNQT